MRSIQFGAKGEQAQVVLERGTADGGLVVCYEINETDGTRTSYRAWYSDPVQARAAYDAATAIVVEERITLKREATEPVREIDGEVTGRR